MFHSQCLQCSLQYPQNSRLGPTMSPPAKDSTYVGDTLWPTVGVSFNVIITAVLFFFILALFFLTLYLYAKHVWALNRILRRRRSRLIFAASDPVTFHRHGLDAAILRSLPITVFKLDPEEELECAVCLCELSDGEVVRMLPKCNHGFHLECIDMWFHSHSTCPLCRSPVGFPVPVSLGIPAPEAVTAESTEATVTIFSETPNGEPATSVSEPNGEAATSVSVSLVIDIPRRVMQGFSSSPSTPLPTSYDYGNPMMETKTATPTSARLRTLTRLLSRGKRTMGPTSTASPREIEDIEQGQGLLVGESPRGVTPRIPRNS